jgi:SAM-dependent methyltransferase
MNPADSPKEKERFSPKVRRAIREKGVLYVVGAVVGRVRVRWKISVAYPFWYNYNRIFNSRCKFVFQKKEYRYFFHKYNVTWRNERTVEVPIVWRIIDSFKGNILEVGNVLSHYFEFEHDIVDKHEKAIGVINEDVTEINTSKKYDLIVSISTLEHVGWDEEPNEKRTVDDPEKIFQAINKLKSLLNPGGKIVVTLPLGYNPHLDELLRSGKLKFDDQFCLKRVSKNNKWIETDCKQALANAKFNQGIPSAYELTIGIINPNPSKE